MPAQATSPAAPPAAWWTGIEGMKGLGGQIPREGWPALSTIEYISKFLVLIIILLAIPYLLVTLVTRPHEVSGHSAGLAMGPTSMGV